jgi:predicted small lipoprotein YifL
MQHRYRWVWLLVPAAMLVACGQKGPLYMEGHEPPAERRAKAYQKNDQDHPQDVPNQRDTQITGESAD